MSMLNRLVRVFEGMATYEQDAKDRGGILGEDYAAYIFAEGENEYYLRNPILPHPRKRGVFFETDFLVYTRGTLFCVEIKNYRGRVYYPPTYRTVYVEKGWWIFKRKVKQQVMSAVDKTKMVQEKLNRSTGRVEARPMPNPLPKTQRFAEDLQRYLQRIDKRLANIPIYSVLGFSEKTDISAIYDFDQGIMHVSELPKFFKKYSNGQFAQQSPAWLMQALQQLPTWDRIWTTENEMFYGTFLDNALTFTDTNGRTQSLPYQNIQAISVKRLGNFSAHDELIVTYTNGKERRFQSANGEIQLQRFQGETQTHKLRNISQLQVGVANKKIL